MTKEQKIAAIKERLKNININDVDGIDEDMLACLVIIGYIGELDAAGIVQSDSKAMDSGKRIITICEEFEYAPSDEDIIKYVSAMVDPTEQAGMAYLLIRYRDNKKGTIKDLKNLFQKGDGDESGTPV